MFLFSYQTHTYCWWLKSCTTWDVWNPINNGIHYLSTGAGFQPSTVSYISYGQRWPFVGINIFPTASNQQKISPPTWTLDFPRHFCFVHVPSMEFPGSRKSWWDRWYLYTANFRWLLISPIYHQLKGTRNKHWFQVSWDWWLSLSSKEVDVISLTLPSHLQGSMDIDRGCRAL